MELSDDAVLKIKDHLMAVADLLGGVHVPRARNGAPRKTDRRVTTLSAMMAAVSAQPTVFTGRMVQASLAANGHKMSLTAANHRLRAMVAQGLISSTERGVFSATKG